MNNKSNFDCLKLEVLLEYLVSYIRKTVANHRFGVQGRGRGLGIWVID